MFVCMVGSASSNIHGSQSGKYKSYHASPYGVLWRIIRYFGLSIWVFWVFWERGTRVDVRRHF